MTMLEISALLVSFALLVICFLKKEHMAYTWFGLAVLFVGTSYLLDILLGYTLSLSENANDWWKLLSLLVPLRDLDFIFFFAIVFLVIIVLYTVIRTSNNEWRKESWGDWKSKTKTEVEKSGWLDKIKLRFESEDAAKDRKAIEDLLNEAESNDIEFPVMSEIKSSAKEQAVLILPSISLVVGLLGTFIAISLALSDANAILGKATAESIDESVSGLTNLVETMGFSFKTSIYGIIGFIIMRLCNLKMEGLRLRWIVKINLIETINRKNKEENKRKERHDKIITTLQEGFGSMASIMENSMTKLGTASTDMSSAATELTKSASSVSTSINGFERTVSTTLGEMKTKFNESIKESSGKIAASSATISEGVVKMTDVSKAGYETIGNCITKISGLVSTAEQSLEDSKQAIIDNKLRMEALQKNISEKLESIADANIGISKVMRRTKNLEEGIKSLEEVIPDVKKFQDVVRKQIDESAATIGKMREMHERLASGDKL